MDCRQNRNTTHDRAPNSISSEVKEEMTDRSDSDFELEPNEKPNNEELYGRAREDKNKPAIIDARYLISFDHVFAGLLFLLQLMFKLGLKEQQEAFKIIVQVFTAWYNMYPYWLSESCYVAYRGDCKCGAYHKSCSICGEEKCLSSHRCWRKFYPLLTEDERTWDEDEIVRRLLIREDISEGEYDRYFRLQNKREEPSRFKSFIEIPEKEDLRPYQKNLISLMKNTVTRKCRDMIVIIDKLGNRGKSYIADLFGQTRDVVHLSPTAKDTNYALLRGRRWNPPSWIIIDIDRSAVKSRPDENMLYKNIENLTNGRIYNSHNRMFKMDFRNTGTILQANQHLKTDCLSGDRLQRQVPIDRIIEATEEELATGFYTFVKPESAIKPKPGLKPTKAWKTESLAKLKAVQPKPDCLSKSTLEMAYSRMLESKTVRPLS